MNKQELFIQKCIKKYGDKFDYSITNYINTKTKISFICKIHGIVTQFPGDHLFKKHGCKQCGIDSMAIIQKERSKELFFKRCFEIHGDRYDYNNVNYLDSHTKISIFCKDHGFFEISPTHHIHMKSGCPTCANYVRSVYNESYFEKDLSKKKLPAFLYLFSLKDSCKSDFLKIGITRQNTKNSRYKIYKNLDGVKLLEKSMDLYDAWKVEQEILLKFKNFRYIPKTDFIGYTECLNFTKLSDILEIINYSGQNSTIPSDSPSSDTVTS